MILPCLHFFPLWSDDWTVDELQPGSHQAHSSDPCSGCKQLTLILEFYKTDVLMKAHEASIIFSLTFEESKIFWRSWWQWWQGEWRRWCCWTPCGRDLPSCQEWVQGTPTSSCFQQQLHQRDSQRSLLLCIDRTPSLDAWELCNRILLWENLIRMQQLLIEGKYAKIFRNDSFQT